MAVADRWDDKVDRLEAAVAADRGKTDRGTADAVDGTNEADGADGADRSP